MAKSQGRLLKLDLAVERSIKKAILDAIQAGLVASAHDLAEGGLAVALAESAISSEGLGAKVEVTGNAVSALFSESQSRFLLSVKKEDKDAFEKLTDATFNWGSNRRINTANAS